MTSAPAVSVVIPTFCRRGALERLLGALVAQTLDAGRFEVIVSIDGSDDGSRELVAGYHAPFALRGIWHPRRGRAAACNAGIRAARGDLLVLLDDDMEPAPELLSAHQQAHRGAVPRAVLGPVPVRWDAASPMAVRYTGAKFDRHLAKLARPGYQLRLRDFYTGNFSIRRDTMLRVGLFDEAFRLYGNEDLELSVRLVRAGVELRFCPEARALQHYLKDFAALAADTVAKGRTARLLVAKHSETFDELKLSTYHAGSRRWRAARTSLLWLGTRWPATTSLLVRLVDWLERCRIPRLDLVYAFVLDYCYWLGAGARARSAPEATRAAGGRARSIADAPS